MFEKILERILLTYFGKFITGFDSGKLSLGVWSGNIVIEDVQLKNTVIENLELPLKIKLSKLGRLVIKIPWNKLSSSPVEVILEDVLLVLNPLDAALWNFDVSSVAVKLNKLVNMANKQLAKKEQQQGYFERLTMKVLDNLQVSIKNIHIRYETDTFSWGVKMQSLEVLTTNKDFVPQFISDATAKHKNVKLQNLLLYWNSNETLFLTEYIPPEQLILSELIRINASCQLTLNDKKDETLPLYEATINLDQINVELKAQQLRQLISVLEFTSSYRRKLNVFRKSLVITNEDNEKLFIELFTQYIKDQKSIPALEDIVKVQEQSQLQEWSRTAVKQLLLEWKVQELQKSKSKKGWFGWGASEGEVSEQEVREIEEYIDSFSSEFTRSKDAPKLSLSVSLKGASIALSNQDEVINLSLTLLSAELKTRGKDLSFSNQIQSIGLSLMLRQQQVAIINPQENELLFFSFLRQDSHISVTMIVNTLHVNYDAYLIKIIRGLIQTRVQNPLKTAAMDRIEVISTQTNSHVKRLIAQKLDVDIRVLNPQLSLPFSNALNSEQWVLKLDSFSITGNDSYNIDIKKGCFEYHPDSFKNNVLNVIKDYDANIKISRDDGLLVSGDFDKLNVVMNELVYRHLIYLPETIFPRETQEGKLQSLNQEKQRIIQSQIKMGYLKKCGTLIKSWTELFVILSETEMHFYEMRESLMAQYQISLLNATVQRDAQYSFRITNRTQDVLLACENEQDLLQWMQLINQQIELNFTRDQAYKKQLIKKRDYQLKINIKLKKLTLRMYKQSKYPSKHYNDQLIFFEMIGFNFTSEEQGKMIVLQSLSLEDWVHDYANPTNQVLIQLNTKKQNALTIQINQSIDISIDNVVLNWKPDSFLTLRQFLLVIKNRKSRQSYYSDLKEHEIDHLRRTTDEIKKSKLRDGLQRSALKCKRYGTAKQSIRQKFESLMDYDLFINDIQSMKQIFTNLDTTLLLNLKASINACQVQCFHRTSHSMLFKAEAKKATVGVKKLQFSYFIEGILQDLSIFDMTNYPYTIDNDKQFTRIKPFKLIGRRSEYSEPVVKFNFGGHDESVLTAIERTNMFLFISLNPIVAIYAHQPIMRTIDYLINHIVTLIKEPECLTMNEGPRIRRAWGDFDFIQNKIICPTFLDLRIKLVKPLIQLKGWQHFSEYFQIDGDEIIVYNKQNIDMSRLLQPGGMQLIDSKEPWMPDGRILQAWSEAYIIKGRNLQIQYFEKNSIGVSTIFNLNLSFERLLHFNEINELFDNVKHDRTIKIRAYLTPLLIKLFRKEYLEICKLIFHNFNYDDTKDSWFVHDYVAARSFEPPPISMLLDFEQLSLMALSRMQPTPIIQIRFIPLRLEWLRGQNIDLNLYAPQVNMYHYIQDSMEVCFVGNIQERKYIQKKGIKDLMELDCCYYEQYELKDNDILGLQIQDNFQFQLLFKNIRFDELKRPLGDKEIYIALKNVKLLVTPSVFAQIGIWSLLEQQCWPPQIPGEMPAIKMIVEISASLCLQGTQILATKGDLCYIWNRSRFLHPDALIEKARKKIIQREEVEAIGDAFEHKVTLKNLELYKCTMEDFMNYDMNVIHKRHIVLPFSLFFCLKNELFMDFQKCYIYYQNKFSLHVDKTICKFSYQDLVLVLDITKKLQEQNKPPIREFIYGEPPQQIVTPVNNVYDVVVLGLQVVVINDAGEAYVPVFDLTLYETQLQFQQTSLKSILSTIIKMSSTFYNPKIGLWEPIIESCAFSVDISLNPQGNPQKIIFIENGQILNLNLSTQMISVFHKTLLSWKKEMAGDYNKEIELVKQQSSYNDENVDYVSPYTIRNETGFTVEVEDPGIRKYILKSGTSTNFQVDSEIEQVFTQENRQRLVTLRIQLSMDEYQEIKGVDIDKIRVKRETIHVKQKQYTLFIEVVPKDTRKLLLISSEMIVFNKTNMNVEINMYEQQQGKIGQLNNSYALIEPMRAFPIPFDRTRQHMTFRFQGGSEYTKNIDLGLFALGKDKKYEYSHSENFTIVRVTKRIVNQTLIFLEPPFQIKNCLPQNILIELYGENYSNKTLLIESMVSDRGSYVMDVTKQKSQFENLLLNQKGELNKQETKQIHGISCKGRLAIRMKLPLYQISDIGLLHVPKQNIIIQDVQLCDYRGNFGFISVELIESTFYLYTQQFAVNEMPQKLFFYDQETKKSTATLISGQQFMEMELSKEEEACKFVILPTQFVQISSFDNASALSQPINLNFTGNQTIKMNSERGIEEMGYNISLACVDKTKPLVTKVLTISPRFVILNNTKYGMRVKQDSSLSNFDIEPNQRKPLFWTSLENQLIQVKIDDEVNWDYSNPIDPNVIGFSCFTLRCIDNLSILKHMNCIARQDNQIIYLIIVECESPVEPPYMIVNNLNMVTLVCYQSCCVDKEDRFQQQEYKQSIPSMKEQPFSWEFPAELRELAVKLTFEGELITQYSMEPLYLSMDENDAGKEFTINNMLQENEQFKFWVINVWEGSSRKLKFVQNLEQQDDTNLLKVNFNISSIGLSIIDFEDQKRVELIYAILKGFELNITQTQQSRLTELKIKYINIDNNTSQRTMFPVILTPTKFKEIFEFNRPHLSIVLEQSTQVNTVQLIKNFKVCLQPTTIRLTSQMLEQLYLVFKTISQSFKDNQLEGVKQYDFEYAIQEQKEGYQSMSNKVQLKYGINSSNDSIEWHTQEQSLDDRATYINRIELYPIEFNLTFYNDINQNVEFGMLIQILRKIGIVVGNIDEAPILLDGIYLENSFDTVSGISVKLITHYKEMFVQIIVKLLVSIEIIGNPLGLVKSLGRGAYDLFDKPIEGFIKGPIEGGIGIAKGATSLVKNTVSGTFNTVSKITGSFGGGLAYISMDRKYQSDRELLRVTKPRQIFQGVSFGGQMLYVGVKRAVSGVFEMPYNGFKKSTKQGVIGALQGSAGFFIKPFGGLFDFISKSTDGVKATAQYWDDKANYNRERPIRVMYDQEQCYRQYNEKDAQLLATVSLIDRKLQTIKYVDSFQFGTVEYPKALVLSTDYIVYIDERKKRKLFQIYMREINDIKIEGQSVVYLLREYNEKLKVFYYTNSHKMPSWKSIAQLYRRSQNRNQWQCLINNNNSDIYFIMQKAQLYVASIFEFLINNQTYEIGLSQTVWRLSVDHKDGVFYDTIFDTINYQLVKYVKEGQEGQAAQYIDLIILIIDALIFNLYSKNKSADRARINHSVYGLSSAYQQSGKFGESVGFQVQEVKVFIKSLEKFVTNRTLFDSLDFFFQINSEDQQKLQLSHFINSIEYILEKEQVNDASIDLYIANKQKIAPFLIEKQKMVEQAEIDEVNSVIFSNKLQLIKKILYIKADTYPIKEVHFSIARIYFAAYSKKRSNFKRKQFQYLDYQGEDMIHNIFSFYVTSVPKRDLLFRDMDQNDPLYDFVLNYLEMLYTPIYLEFQRLFDQYIYPNFKMSPAKLFVTLKDNFEPFLQFFQTLPSDLLNLLSEFFQVVQDAQHFTDSTPPLFPIKNLFISKFLLSPIIKESYISTDYSMDVFVDLANKFKDLFFQNTNRSYSNLPEFVEMGGQLRLLLENYISTYEFDKNLDVYSYFITDPLLRNDYSYVYTYINTLKILPSDQKEYPMEKFQSFLPKRMVAKDFKKQLMQPEKPELKPIQSQQQQIQDPISSDRQQPQDLSLGSADDHQQYNVLASPKDQEPMFEEVRMVSKFTQTEVPLEEEKQVEKFQNFDNEDLNNISNVTPVNENEERDLSKKGITQSSQMIIMDDRATPKSQIRQQSQHVQQIVTIQNDEELTELRKQIQEMEAEFQDQLQKQQINSEKREQVMEYQIQQFTLQNNILITENRLQDGRIEQLEKLVEKLQEYNDSLLQEARELRSEKQVLVDHFQNISLAKLPDAQKTHKDRLREFDQLNGEISNTQKIVLQSQAQHEIQRRLHM